MLGHVLLGKMLRCEHGRMLDVLVELSHALGKNDLTTARRLISALIQLTGPHLRCEEESLFPSLVPILGMESIADALSEHDQLIACVLKLEEFSRLDPASDQHSRVAMNYVHLLVRYVTACDRLDSYIAQLSDENAKAVLVAHDKAFQEQINLAHWSEWMRERPVPPAPSVPTVKE